MTSLISGTFVVDAAVFERWAKFDIFLRDIEDVCAILQYRTNHACSLDKHRLELAHSRFVAHSAAWLEYLLPAGTSQLSHLKSAAIFIESMTEISPIEVGDPLKPIPAHSYQDGGVTQMLAPERLEARELKKFTDGQTHMIAWLIGYHICEFFESKRTDRIDPYASRTTDEFETDLVSGLLSGRVSAQAMHLILKALFLRD